MTIHQPTKAVSPATQRQPAASSSSSRASGSSQTSSGGSGSGSGSGSRGDIELPAYSTFQPSSPTSSSSPPSYDNHPEGLFPNYRPDKQGPDPSAEQPAAIEEGRVGISHAAAAAVAPPAIPAVARAPPAPAAVPVPAPVLVPAPAPAPGPVVNPRPALLGRIAATHRTKRCFDIYRLIALGVIVGLSVFLLFWWASLLDGKDPSKGRVRSNATGATGAGG